MSRVTVTDDEGTTVGWYDLDRAEGWSEGTRWDGNNHVSRATGSQYDHEELRRTAGGRWAIHSWSQWQGRGGGERFIEPTEALDWLVQNQYPRAEIQQIIGVDLEEERGPGRPAIGRQVTVTLPEDQLATIDAMVTGEGVKTRADAIRVLIGRALA